MPARGPAPKSADQRLRQNKPSEWVEVPNVPFAGNKPKLPARRTVMTAFGPKDVTIKTITRDWWNSISSMPHCILWTPSDWTFALVTAMVADAAFTGGIGSATELRNREKILGTTVDFRKALRIRYVDPPSEENGEAADVVELDSYRSL